DCRKTKQRTGPTPSGGAPPAEVRENDTLLRHMPVSMAGVRSGRQVIALRPRAPRFITIGLLRTNDSELPSEFQDAARKLAGVSCRTAHGDGVFGSPAGR